MNVLVLVAMAGAAVLGEWSQGATVVSLFAVANALESWSGSRARSAVAALMHVTPRHAHVLEGGVERCVPAEHLLPGRRSSCARGSGSGRWRGRRRRHLGGRVALTGKLILLIQKRVGDSVFADSLAALGLLEQPRLPALRHICGEGSGFSRGLLASGVHTQSSGLSVSRGVTPPAGVCCCAVLAIVPAAAGIGSWNSWLTGPW